ncbi:MAG: helix-turn-helix transcriptional regulator [Verrucomicrobia bacterium]|nr:helix-turn-helix transcriptional regulator [Lachnospiraceae bacterium]MBR4250085.1 helix-turn-helix transcriptional regulator [Verrucomicrobiota bacterium]
MAAKKTVGTLIKEARTAAGLSQTKLADMVDGVSSSDIGKAERDEKELTKEALKQIAKATGVTQKSLLEAPSGVKKTETTSSAKKTSSSAKKTSSSSTAKKTEELTLTATEKKLVELYREADSDTKKKATKILKGESFGVEDIASAIMSLIGGGSTRSAEAKDVVGQILAIMEKGTVGSEEDDIIRL